MYGRSRHRLHKGMRTFLIIWMSLQGMSVAATLTPEELQLKANWFLHLRPEKDIEVIRGLNGEEKLQLKELFSGELEKLEKSEAPSFMDPVLKARKKQALFLLGDEATGEEFIADARKEKSDQYLSSRAMIRARAKTARSLSRSPISYN